VGTHKYGYKLPQTPTTQDGSTKIAKHGPNYANSNIYKRAEFLAPFFFDEHENIVNRPNYVLLNQRHLHLMATNLKLKYLSRYEQRVHERDLNRQAGQGGKKK